MCTVTKPIKVKILSDLSCTGKEKWKNAQIDECIAPLIEALQIAGIDMRGSCCGHGKMDGDIHLQDGRVLVIKNNADEYFDQRWIDLSEYIQAKFDTIFKFDNGWVAGFFCQGVESLSNDGLICYLPVQNKSYIERNK